MLDNQKLAVGQRVKCLTRKHFVSTGVIIAISYCGRYVSVQKRYGTKCCWHENYLATDLRPLCNKNKAGKEVPIR